MSSQLTSQTIWNSVKELLHKHDCVIMPNFGGFVCNPENARIDQISHIITPPARRVMFNQNLKSNDGLLAQTVAQNNGLSYSDALKAIDDIITEFKNKLELVKQIEIETFGIFRLNAEANYVFLPHKHNTYLFTSFGLMPLQATPVIDLAIGTKRTRLFKDRKNTAPIGKKQRAKNVALKALTAVLVVMLGLNAYIFLTNTELIGGAKMSTTGVHTWFDSLMAGDNQPSTISNPEPPQVNHIPEATSVTKVPEQPLVEQPVSGLTDSSLLSASTILNIAEAFAYSSKSAPIFGDYCFGQDGNLIATEVVKIPKTELEENPSVISDTKSEVVVTENNSATLSFHIIGGVFCNEANARKYYNMLKSKGFDAQLLLNKKINCNRVSYGKLGSREEALRLMDSIKSTENPEAWVLAVKE
jgi:nucleoid DNA-binding protein